MIYIIVPTFARIDDSRKFIDSIDKSIKEDYLIILIDDHPNNITYQELKGIDKVRILIPLNELWWVGSINLGIKTLFDEYDLKDDDKIIFANNDVQIDKKSFDILMYELNKGLNKIVHPRTFDQDNIEVSSGTKILSYFPYITIHPKNFDEEKIEIEMGTARFLCMQASVLKKIGLINQDLIQYLGDNDFTLRAKRKYDIKTYILKNSVCRLDDTDTGIKNNNIPNIKELYKSFFSIKSPNNIKYRYIFFKKHFNSLYSFFITSSMTFNTIVKFFINKVRN